MKTVRSMILVSNDPESNARGSEKIFRAFQQQLREYGLRKKFHCQWSVTLAIAMPPVCACLS